MTLTDSTMFDWLCEGIKSKADQPLVERRGEWHSGKTVLCRAETRKKLLVGAGFKQGDCALVLVQDNLLALEICMAVWALGGCTALVDFKLPDNRLEEYIEATNPNFIIAAKHKRRQVSFGAGVILELPFEVPLDDLPLTAVRAVQREDKAIYITSSGTTAAPRAAARSQGGFCDYVQANEARNGFHVLTGGHFCAIGSLAFSANLSAWLTHLSAGRSIIALDLF